MTQLTPLALAVAAAKRAGAGARGADKLKTDAAMEELTPFIRETASRIHGRYYALRRQLASDFVSLSPALIWTRIDHFESWYFGELPEQVRREESKDFFAAWCYRELHFRYLDTGRTQKAQPRTAALELVGDVEDTRSALESGSVYDFSLSENEATELADWDALDGVILFTLAGQWSQVPEKLRTRWIAELGLDEPFPPEAFEKAPRVKKRACLAEALGVSRDVIFQRWHRLKSKYLA